MDEREAELGAYKRCRRELSGVRGFGKKNRDQPRKRERASARLEQQRAWGVSIVLKEPTPSHLGTPPLRPSQPPTPAQLPRLSPVPAA